MLPACILIYGQQHMRVNRHAYQSPGYMPVACILTHGDQRMHVYRHAYPSPRYMPLGMYPDPNKSVLIKHALRLSGYMPNRHVHPPIDVCQQTHAPQDTCSRHVSWHPQRHTRTHHQGTCRWYVSWPMNNKTHVSIDTCTQHQDTC